LKTRHGHRVVVGEVNEVQELDALLPLLSFGHLPLKGKTPFWELGVRKVYALI
jgi:hypothetical protein